MDERVERFKALMRALNPSEDPRKALERGHVLRHPRNVGGKIADYLTIQPDSTHVIVGGIGSGKSTELMAIEQKLNAREDMAAIYIDVAKEQDPDSLKDGDLLLLFGLKLSAALSSPITPEQRNAVAWLTDFALGTWDTPEHGESPYEDEPRHPEIWVTGNIRPPVSASQSERVGTIAKRVATLLAVSPGRDHVALFDSLDRHHKDDVLSLLLDQDVRVLSELGVGVVTAMPLRHLYGGGHSIVDRVQQFWHLPYIDVARDSVGRAFMVRMLMTRAPTGMLAGDAAEAAVDASGGVLRDAISITKMAAMLAFSLEKDSVGLDEMAAAIRAYGQDHRLGLDTARMKVLREMTRAQSAFVPTSELGLEMIQTRRVLHYVGPDGDRFELHPAIAELIKPRARPQETIV